MGRASLAEPEARNCWAQWSWASTRAAWTGSEGWELGGEWVVWVLDSRSSAASAFLPPDSAQSRGGGAGGRGVPVGEQFLKDGDGALFAAEADRVDNADAGLA